MTDRCFENPFSDYEGEPQLKENEEEVASFKMRLASEVDRHLATISHAQQSGLISADNHSAYTGTTGIALLHLLLHKRTGAQQHLHTALSLVEPCLGKLPGKGTCTLLCGDGGPLCVAAVAYHYLGAVFLDRRDACVQRILKMHESVTARGGSAGHLPDEMLYGRCGYLSCLLFLEQHIGQQYVSSDIIEKVICAVLDSGKTMGSKVCPLMYAWHEKCYLGAAHGAAGIFYHLLKLHGRFPHLNIDRFVKPSVDHLMTLRFASGNYPSSLESREKDVLVQWCHGAPGWVYMFSAAYEVFKDAKYLAAAEECADVTWRRGLLRKGYGLCHGVAGNAYAFLAMYRLTGEERHVHRACKFAQWCFDYGKHGCRSADRPYSLFEGLAGTAYFLLDIQVPSEARFPAYELN